MIVFKLTLDGLKQDNVHYFESMALIERSLKITYCNLEDKPQIVPARKNYWRIMFAGSCIGDIQVLDFPAVIHKEAFHL